MTPPKLAFWLLCLPPILYIIYQVPISSYSKAPRGLFVLSRVAGVLTGSLISPSLLLRQRSSRYAIRAGRNLPDKEFRYLRTVIVTAAVYWGFNSMLRCLTSPLNLPAPGRRQPLYISFRFSRDLCFWLTVAWAISLRPAVRQAPLLPKLRGHFAEFLNNSSLARLRILSSSTCVGLRYGHLRSR